MYRGWTPPRGQGETPPQRGATAQPQHQQEVRDRLKTGEPKENIARAYGVDVDVIGRLAR